MQVWFLYAAVYAAVAWAVFLSSKFLTARAADTLSRNAFTFALTAAWPLALVLAVCMFLLVVVAALYMAPSWLRRAPP